MLHQRKLTIAFVVGTRPEAIKLAPVIQAFKALRHYCRVVVIATGQHREMLTQVFTLFGITPDVNLQIMRPNQTLDYVSSVCLSRLPVVFKNYHVDLLLVQGDTSTAFSSALSAFYNNVRIGHIEAGLRTPSRYNPFPEEVNRRLLSHLADYHFAATQGNKENLMIEGISEDSVFVTGNTVIDALHAITERPYSFEQETLRKLEHNRSRKILVTCHRRESFGGPMKAMCQAFSKLVREHNDIEIVYPVHMNPNVRATMQSELSNRRRIHLLDPLPYESFAHLMKISHLILTDSGGIQEEAPSLGKPVLVLRETTERTEAISAGTAKLIGTRADDIVREASNLLNNDQEYEKMTHSMNRFGDGLASSRIVQTILHLNGLEADMPKEFVAPC